MYPPRRPDGRKGDHGRVLVLGGSERYAGAPAFNALAALRAGADLAVVVAPRRAADLVASYSPDLITVPCATPWPDPRVAEEELAKADAVVMGGGVERSPFAHAALRACIAACGKPMALDAEALHALAGHERALQGKRALLTPHGGELKLLGEDARTVAKRLGQTVVLKGARDLVTDGAREHADEHGSPYLTKGGYGDLLAGAAAAFLARGAPPFDAGVAAAELVGRAGALAAAKLGESTLASDALARFPDAIREALGQRMLQRNVENP